LTREDPVVLEHIGDVCAKLDKSAQALEAWQKALSLDPKNKTLAEKIENAKTKMSKGQSPNANPIH
jgi:predicted negative regulator of RcsB-dependent stress response